MPDRDPKSHYPAHYCHGRSCPICCGKYAVVCWERSWVDSIGPLNRRSREDKDLEGPTLDSSKALGASPSNISETDEASDFLQKPIVDLSIDSSTRTPTLHQMKAGEEKYPKWQSGDSEHILRLKRAWMVQSSWASIENVCKISSSVLVNKLQCEHIADHFKVTADVLQKLGLGKDFVSSLALEGGSGIQTNLVFDEAHFSHIAETFEKHFFDMKKTDNMVGSSLLGTQIQDISSMFKDYICELDTLIDSNEGSSSKQSKVNEDSREYSLRGMSTEENDEAQSHDHVQYPLDEFLCLLLGVLKEGEDLVLVHSRLEGANNKGVVERTGLYGEKFVHIHKLLYELLQLYACLDHCEGTEFARGYLPQHDSCRAQSLLYYLNSGCLGEITSLSIDDDFLNIELATTISELLERPNCILKTLLIEPSSRVKVDQVELRKCRLMVIAALNKCMSIISLTVRGSNGEEVHEMCKSLSVNKVLENLVISTDGPLEDNNARNLDPDATYEILDSLKKNKTLQVLDLQGCSNIGNNSEVAACLEAMLVENSTLEELKVDIRTWDEFCLKHLLRPLRANKDGEPPINISLRRLHILNYNHDGGWDVAKSIAQMLRTNKMLSHFSMINASLNTQDACTILGSLKINKTLQVLNLEECKGLDEAWVKVVFMDLLVNYNFSLKMIEMDGRDWNIEAFMKVKLEPCIIKHELWSVVDGLTKFPDVHSAHDLKQDVGTLQLEEGEGSTKEVCGSSVRASDKNKSKVEAKDERPRLFLSYSNEMRDFAMQLCMELKSSNYNVVDQDSINSVEVVDHCQLAIVIISNMYVNSKPSMSVLYTIVESKKTNNPTLKVYPLFYKLTLKDLQNAFSNASTCGGEVVSLDNASRKEAVNFLLEGKEELAKKASDLVRNLRQGKVDVGKFCEQFSEVLRSSWPCNGVEFEENATFEEYLRAILREIFHYMPAKKECNNDQISGHQIKLEMESKVSLRQIEPFLETILMTNFYLRRELNMTQHLQEKYIQYSSFEEMCPLDLCRDQKHEYSTGRIAAALFPSTFLYHFKAHMLRGLHDGNFLPMLKGVADLVAHMMQQEYNKNGVQISTFFDFVDYGAPLDPKITIAKCQNFSTNTSNGSKQLVIVQDDLTGAYYYQSDEASKIGNLAFDETIGVIGVQVASTEIYVDNIHEDGSSYSGVLGDFSYKFDFDENKQCAMKAFGELEGARFLSKNSGIKCSPLLVIALASAIQKKGLALTWSNAKGHMEFSPKHAHKMKVEVEVSACQIQYSSNINQLGLEIEWGTGTNSCAPHNQTFQRRTNEIVNQQVLGSNVDQNVGTSGSKDDDTTNVDCATNMQNHIALYNAAAQNKSKRSIAIKVAGTGFDFGNEKHDSKIKQLMNDALQNIRKQQFLSKKGFHKISTLNNEYPDLENRLLRCQLHQVPDNYLVVYNVSKAQHISVYDAIEQNEVVPKFELTWITDLFIEGGEEEIKRIFETGLKGRELIVKRDGSNFTQLGGPFKPLEKIVPGYQESLLKFKSRFPMNTITTSMIPISMPNLDGMLRSKNEWVHILGPQEKYEVSHKYWWNTTFMEAIVYSRNMYTSGTLLKLRTEKPFDGIGHIGYCSVEEGPKEFKHLCGSMVSRGKFSRPPGSLLSHKVLWGGLDIVPENLSL